VRLKTCPRRSNLTCASTWPCLRQRITHLCGPSWPLIQAALRASFRRTSSNRALYCQTLTLHRAVVAAIEAGDDDRSEAAMLAVLAETSLDIAIQTKLATSAQHWSR